MRRPSHSATVTAGLKWPPEMCPNAYAPVSTASPNASATPSRPTPTSSKRALSTAVPQPANTNQNVPISSTASRRPSPGGVGSPTPSTLLAHRRGDLTRGA